MVAINEIFLSALAAPIERKDYRSLSILILAHKPRSLTTDPMRVRDSLELTGQVVDEAI